MEKPTPAEVRAIAPWASTDDAVVQSFIDDAELVAEQCPSLVSASTAKQKAVIKWLAAHLMAMTGTGSASGSSSGVLTSKALGDASESYAAPKMGVNLQSTSYGQRALLLDESGCLVALGEKLAQVDLIGC